MWIKNGNENTIEEVFLRNMQVPNLQAVNDWFRKSYAGRYRIDRLTEAVAFTKERKNRPIWIFGDYDVDGVTSTSILYLSLKWAGFTNVNYRIPKRFSEGFGVNKAMVDEVDKKSLIITCDNGVAQIEAVNYAKELGLEVIIIDHHQAAVNDDKEKIFPNADIIINPEAIDGSADFCGYCGAGLCYRFACELLDYKKELCQKLLVLAAIGTIADVMKLHQENYVIVRNGIKTMSNQLSCTVGTYALLSALNLTNHIDAEDIGFKIGPVINAASRMNDDGAKDAIELLISEDDYFEARKKAEKLVALNNKRKEIQTDTLNKAKEIIKDNNLCGEVPMVIYIPNVHEGVIGIVAGNLCEDYKVPTIVLTDTEKEGIIKGSGRSCGNYNLKEELDECANILLNYGGHEGAAGLSLCKAHFEVLKKKLQAQADNYLYEDVQNVSYDLEISANEISEALSTMQKFAPYGEGNPSPVFRIKDFAMINKYGECKKLMGADLSTVKIFSKDADAIGFGMAKSMENIKNEHILSIIGNMSYNFFNGKVSNQVLFSEYEIQ